MSIIPELKRSYFIPIDWIDFMYRPLFLMIQDSEEKDKNPKIYKIKFRVEKNMDSYVTF